MLKKLIAVALLALLPTLPACADAVTGQVSVFGTSALDLTNQTIAFSAGRPFAPTGTAPGDPFTVVTTESGDFLGLGTGGTLTWRNEGSPVAWSGFGSGSNLSCGVSCLFVGASNGLDISFAVTSFSQGYADPTFTLLGLGVINLTGFDATAVPFSLTTQGGLNLGFTAISPGGPAPVPGPLVGAGFPGLMAIGGMLLLWRRRRNAPLA